MPNAIFCVDHDRIYTYTALLGDIKAARSYYPCRLFDNLNDYFRNLILALIYNRSITLLDSDLRAGELQDLGVSELQAVPIEDVRSWGSIEEVIGAVQASTAEVVMFTSGTTGQPKKVVHTPASLMRNIRYQPEAAKHVWGYAYNPTHMAGLQVFLQALCNGSMLVNLFRCTRSEIYDLIVRYQITHLSATPTFYRLLLPVGSVCPTVRRVTFGGEKSDAKLHGEILQIFPAAKINNIYASTEAGALFSSRNDAFHVPAQIRDKVRIEEGELLIHRSLLGHSPTFQFEDDYYHTGDLVEWVNQEEGIFRIVSRKNELINVGGYKINPNEVEEVIRQLSQVQNCVVYGKSNSVLGNILCADIEILSGTTITESEVRQMLATRLQSFKIPRRIRFVEHIELTKTGKLKRK